MTELELLRVVLQLLILEGKFLLELLVQAGELLLLAVEDEQLELEVLIVLRILLEAILVGVAAMMALSECLRIKIEFRMLLASYWVPLHAI